MKTPAWRVEFAMRKTAFALLKVHFTPWNSHTDRLCCRTAQFRLLSY